MRHCIFLLLLVVAQTAAIGAHAKLSCFYSDGIRYSFLSGKDHEVEVTQANYSGDIDIPATVSNNDQTYTVTQIGKKAFTPAEGNPGVLSVKLPATIVKICEEAFRDAEALTEINLPESIETIDEKAFYRCTALHSISIP